MGVVVQNFKYARNFEEAPEQRQNIINVQPVVLRPRPRTPPPLILATPPPILVKHGGAHHCLKLTLMLTLTHDDP